jgi:hypothetical protein
MMRYCYYAGFRSISCFQKIKNVLLKIYIHLVFWFMNPVWEITDAIKNKIGNWKWKLTYLTPIKLFLNK